MDKIKEKWSLFKDWVARKIAQYKEHLFRSYK